MFKFRDHKIDIGLIFVSVVLVVGILMSFYGATYANLSILLGTFGFGVCFYLKANHGADSKSGQKLSSYGHFMVGLAALITLPQTPEMLDKITEITKGVSALKSSQKKIQKISEKIDNGVKALDESLCKITKLLEVIKVQITDLPAQLAANEADAKSPEDIKKIIRSFVPQPPKEGSPDRLLADGNTFEGGVRSKWGAAYLPRKKADEIIDSLTKEGFTKENVKLQLQKNLEVRGLSTSP